MISTTLNMSEDHFIRDNYYFKNIENKGTIKNEGILKAKKAETIALIANTLKNKGLIETPEGTFALITGNNVTLTMLENNLINYEINDNELKKLVNNKNAVSIDDHSVLLTDKGKRVYIKCSNQ